MEILNKSTLVLNSAYQPIEKVHWIKAFIKVFQGRARAVEYYSDVVRSPNDEYFIPAVIVCTEFSRLPRRKTTYSRGHVIERDNYLCQYCHRKLTKNSATIDHVLPRSRGGKSSFLNCVASCEPCNAFKADRTPEEAKMKLVRKPRKPFIHPLKGKIGEPEPEWTGERGSTNYLAGVI